MSDALYDALEACLDALQRGAEVESCLARYPELADQLRPLLAAAVDARALAGGGVPAEAAKRGKARLLNAAAEMRERGAPRATRGFRRSFVLTLSTVTAAIVLVILLSSAGLVYASSSSLPGDALYPVKLSWEGLQLQLAGSQSREALQNHFEQERVTEVDKLLQRGRSEQVEFIGAVTALLPDRIVASDITVFLTDQTEVEGQLAVGALVQVKGITQTDSTVIARNIRVLPANPGQGEGHDGGGDNGQGHGSGPDSGKKTATPEGSGDDSGGPTATSSGGGSDSSGDSTPQPQSFDLEGKITKLSSGSLVVGGTQIKLDSSTEIRGTLAEGVKVRARGYIYSNGTYLATRVEVVTSDEGGGGSGNSEGGSATATPTATSSSGGGSGSGGGEDGEGSSTPTPTP
jgi:hypothetical protein